jgi:hypothetical protein
MLRGTEIIGKQGDPVGNITPSPELSKLNNRRVIGQPIHNVLTILGVVTIDVLQEWCGVARHFYFDSRNGW